nr:retrovirus-related Pol polyprotein from transposon TNT 1-94 [Tanacetum cinerariifolium]
MSNTSGELQAAGSDTRPHMLDRTDYGSWAQKIRLYCRVKKMVLTFFNRLIMDLIRWELPEKHLGQLMMEVLPLELTDLTLTMISMSMRRRDLMQIFKLLTLSFKGYPKTSTNSSTITEKLKQFGTMGDRIRGTLLEVQVQLGVVMHKIELGMLIRDKENQSSTTTMVFLDTLQGSALSLSTYRCKLKRMEPYWMKKSCYFLQDDDCDAFDSDVDDEPTAQTIFMANLSSAVSSLQHAGPSNASILSEVLNLENSINHHEIPNEVQQINILDSDSADMGVNSVTKASRSQLRRNTKIDRTLTAKSGHKKNVEDHLRNNKSDLHKKNRVDFGISFKRAVVNSNSNSHCKACCSKHMTGDRSRLRNFVKKFIGIVRFRNDHFRAIIGYGDYVIGDSMMSRASKNKSWLWHRRLNHLNFDTINDLARKDLVRGLPRLKFKKDHLCSACQLGKSKKYTHKPKTVNTIMEVLHTLYMDLCRPMRVQSINGKKYILAIIDDYSRFTWVKFLRTKDETLEVIIKLIKRLQVRLNKTVRNIRTDNGTKFVNRHLIQYYDSVGISHQKSVPRTPQQNGVVERRNRTLVEAARTMLTFSKALTFLWAKAIATACYIQNRSLIHTLHNKTSYELVHDKKLDLFFLRVLGTLCYPTNDSEDLGKLQAKADIGFFVRYAPNRKGYRIYNKQTRQIKETIHVAFDELTWQTVPDHINSGPTPDLLTPRPISSGLVPSSATTIPCVPPTNKELEMLFQPMFDEYFDTLPVSQLVPPAPAVHDQVFQPAPPAPADHVPVSPTGTPASFFIE